MSNVIAFDTVRRVAREADSLSGIYGYGKTAAAQFRRTAVRQAMHSDQPSAVIAHQCVPPKSRRLGDFGPFGGAA